MTNFIITHFIKDHTNVHSAKVRESYGKVSGIVGIITNILLSLVKILAGVFTNSIAILADGINNLTDAASSVITFVGFKLAGLKRDKDHPFGHARLEYITGMVISALIIVIGFEILTSSYNKIVNPESVKFSYYLIIILVVSILLKIWQALFYRKMGRIISSSALKATSADSRNDVISTIAILIGLIFTRITGIDIDGYLGVLVAIFIIYSGIMLIKETSSPLLGQAPDPQLVNDIENMIMKNKRVLGVHDLVVHDYGPGNIFASVHIEVDAYEDIMKSHDVIDNLERKISNELKIELVAHMDPVDTKNPMIETLSSKINEYIKSLDGVVDMHDLRVVKGETHTNIIFDLVLSIGTEVSKTEIHSFLEKKLREIDPNYFLVITYDIDYNVRNQ